VVAPKQLECSTANSSDLRRRALVSNASNREVVGFGGTASYDSTLNGKVLDLAIREAVNRLVEGIDKGTWKLKANR
jgi:curli biogenesis system outer membrane secretion channel CsgG